MKNSRLSLSITEKKGGGESDRNGKIRTWKAARSTSTTSAKTNAEGGNEVGRVGSSGIPGFWDDYRARRRLRRTLNESVAKKVDWMMMSVRYRLLEILTGWIRVYILRLSISLLY